MWEEDLGPLAGLIPSGSALAAGQPAGAPPGGAAPLLPADEPGPEEADAGLRQRPQRQGRGLRHPALAVAGSRRLERRGQRSALRAGTDLDDSEEDDDEEEVAPAQQQARRRRQQHAAVAAGRGAPGPGPVRAEALGEQLEGLQLEAAAPPEFAKCRLLSAAAEPSAGLLPHLPLDGGSLLYLSFSELRGRAATLVRGGCWRCCMPELP